MIVDFSKIVDFLDSSKIRRGRFYRLNFDPIGELFQWAHDEINAHLTLTWTSPSCKRQIARHRSVPGSRSRDVVGNAL